MSSEGSGRDADGGVADSRRSRQLLVAAWALLLAVVGGVILWLLLSAPEQPPAPVEPVVVAAPPPGSSSAPAPPPAPPAAAAPAEAPPAAAPSPPATSPAAPAPPPPVAAVPVPAPSAAPPRPPEARPLPPVPDPALVTPGREGLLPVVAPDGRQAWRVYARPFDAAEQRPRLAIVLGDLGLSQQATMTAIQKLPAGVTLAFAPYAGNLQDWIAQARAAGHEVLLQLPMEPLDYPASDPGPKALLTSLSPADNQARLEWVLSRVTGYVGVTNYMGSKFTMAPEALRPVLAELKGRGLLFLDSRSNQQSVGGRLAREVGLPVALNNRFLDNEASRTAIDARLDELERIARAGGTAVGIGYPYPVTIERIAAWAQRLPERGLVLAPVSAVVNRQPPE
jgi:hypothetical protein